jgi:hypothetical protein
MAPVSGVKQALEATDTIFADQEKSGEGRNYPSKQGFFPVLAGRGLVEST